MTDSMLILLALALAAAVAAFVVGRYFTAPRAPAPAPGGEISAVELARLQERERLLGSQLLTLGAQVETLRNDYLRQNEELAGARERAAGSEERITGLAGQIDRAGKHLTERDLLIEQLRTQHEDVRQQLAGRNSELAAAAERQTALQRVIADRDEQLKGLQERLKTEFENMANRILAATANDLSIKSQESLAAILEPLKERIAEFQQKVEATHIEDTKERATIAEQIRQVTQAGQSIGAQAENLTKALKGDSQLRGRWGEVRLERILEQAGLERGREFVVQGGDFNLKAEDGGSLRPDVIVLLPENRQLVIDSKLSLVHYLEFEAAEDDDTRAIALRRLIASVRGHAESLGGKNYQTSDGLNAHDLVLMFVPIEGVAAVVLKNDDDLYSWCWSRRVVMVSPSTLFMSMQTVASIWRYERQNENAQVIAQQAGQLYDKLAGLVDDLNGVSQKLQSAADAHADAMKKLSTGRGNALARAQRLKTLGVASKKDMPAVLLGGERHVVDADDSEEPDAASEPPLPRLLESPAEVADGG
ncbi:MAG TPA: DNA recombination protein RmuC [Rhizomicrobium sp.]|jgi:DNA recombination protein RmuC|nr:DNA recombination protein RmuC [Rhizomicrobium sp.]